jgi:GNAT superfamily N-acetyltransferase
VSTGDDELVPSFDRYLAGLVASWEALAVPHPDARVAAGAGFVAARFPDPVLNNAVVLAADAIPAAEAIYDGTSNYALWTRDGDRESVAELTRRGYQPAETTRPMVCLLADVREPGGPGPTVLSDADPVRVAELNGVAPDLVLGVPGLCAYATNDYRSGLVTIAAGSDVNVSLVATTPTARGLGLATAVVRAALADARSRGFDAASLQSTPMAERLYLRCGFRPVGHWQEWTLWPIR